MKFYPGIWMGVDMASGNDCTWTTTSVRIVNESPEAKLKRLESEQRRVADELGAVRKQIEDARKPPKTRAQKVMDEVWWQTRDQMVIAYDAEIADAKAEQREADAKITEEYWDQPRCPSAQLIRNQK